jgi:hypothetical protein
MSHDPILVDLPVAAKLLSVSERGLANYVRLGLVPVVRLRGRVLFDPQSLRVWASQQSRPEPQPSK